MSNKKNNSDTATKLLTILHAEACTAMYDEELERTGDYRRKTDIYKALSAAELQGPGHATILAGIVVKNFIDDYVVMTDLLMALKYKQKYYETAEDEEQSQCLPFLHANTARCPKWLTWILTRNLLTTMRHTNILPQCFMNKKRHA